MLLVVTLKRILLDTTLGLCPSTAESNPLPLSPSFSVQCSPYPMLFLVVCHLSKDVSVFQLILRHLLSSILCFPWSIYCLSFERCAGPISISLFWRVPVTLVLCIMMVILSAHLTFRTFLSTTLWLVSSFFLTTFFVCLFFF